MPWGQYHICRNLERGTVIYRANGQEHLELSLLGEGEENAKGFMTI